MRDRKAERAKRKQLFERLKLQADILCESYNSEAKSTVILGRMMLILLEIVGKRGMNSERRQALADHFTDCATSPAGSVVELGGPSDRDIIYISGHYRIGDLARRIAWGDARGAETLENSA